VETVGSIACWGDDTYGQTTPPADTFKSVSTGGFHTCGVRSDGTIVCWGENAHGQITPPSDTSSTDDAGAAPDDANDGP
jgi:alpha-tubulin suppressor-like RCC1 family protein